MHPSASCRETCGGHECVGGACLQPERCHELMATTATGGKLGISTKGDGVLVAAYCTNNPQRRSKEQNQKPITITEITIT